MSEFRKLSHFYWCAGLFLAACGSQNGASGQAGAPGSSGGASAGASSAGISGAGTSAGGAFSEPTAGSSGSAGAGTPSAGGTGGSREVGGASGAGNATAIGGSATGGGGGAGGASALGSLSACTAGATAVLARTDVLASLRLGNDYFVSKWPDPTINIDKSHPSNLWTRAVYYEGLMALYGIEPDATRKTSYYDYAVKWGASPSHPWQLVNGGTSTHDADYQCCGQTYLDLYRIDGQAVRVHDIKADIDGMVASAASTDWTWVDAIQMAMPVFAKLGVQYGSTGYFDKMHALYVNAKTTRGFYNPTDHLWWRDASFKPPFTTPNGKQCYWSRGNGWVFAALTRALDAIPTSASGRAEYLTDFVAMAGALQKIQRSDGFWNASLADPNDHGGPELTGTALFTYGMAWGVRNGLLDAATYMPTISRAWCAMQSAVHDNGALGYAQGSGSKPADGQPVTFDSVPDYSDFPLGCFLLGGSEVWKLAAP